MSYCIPVLCAFQLMVGLLAIRVKGPPSEEFQRPPMVRQRRSAWECRTVLRLSVSINISPALVLDIRLRRRRGAVQQAWI